MSAITVDSPMTSAPVSGKRKADDAGLDSKPTTVAAPAKPSPDVIKAGALKASHFVHDEAPTANPSGKGYTGKRKYKKDLSADATVSATIQLPEMTLAYDVKRFEGDGPASGKDQPAATDGQGGAGGEEAKRSDNWSIVLLPESLATAEDKQAFDNFESQLLKAGVDYAFRHKAKWLGKAAGDKLTKTDDMINMYEAKTKSAEKRGNRLELRLNAKGDPKKLVPYCSFYKVVGTDPETGKKLTEPCTFEDAKAGSRVVALINCSDMWFVGKQMGTYHRAVQIVITQQGEGAATSCQVDV